MKHTVLLLDDEPKVLAGLTRLLQGEPYRILTAVNAEEAAATLHDEHVDLIVSDEEMPGMSGTEFLGKVAEKHPDIVRIVLTGRPSLAAALRAINDGKVYQFFTKPCNEVDLAITIRRALEQKDLVSRSKDLLEVTKRQSILIDEARILRRLDNLPRRDRTEAVAKERKAIDQRGLLDEIDEEVAKGRELLEGLPEQPPPPQ